MPCSDRPGLRNVDLVQKINRKLDDVLQKAVSSSHPENPNLFNELKKKIPDLRTLNTLHSEKLLAYKMEPRNGQSEAPNGHNESQSNVCKYSNLFPKQWTQLASIGGNQNKHLDDENSSASPAQGSHHEWSSDSKDGPDASFGSPRSMSSNGMSVDECRMRSNSISSANKSYSEVHDNGLYRSSHMSAHHMNRPLKASASASSPQNDLSNHEHNGSNGEECYYRIDSHLKNNLSASMLAIGSIGNSANNYSKIRRVDSPTDSGIESGKEHGNGSTPTTSVCSSPRSAMDDKVKDVSDYESNEKHESIDDMPMLKRALQAPPLVNTNKLMDEAYRHHKKFRAAQRKDDAHSPSTTTTLSAHPIQDSLATSHSTLLKTLEQPSKYMNEHQLKRTDLIHNIIMRNEAASAPTTTPSNWKNVRHSEMNGHNGHYMYHNVPHLSPNTSTNVPNGVHNGVPTGAVVQSLLSGGQQSKNSVVVCPPGLYIPSGYTSQSCPYSSAQSGRSAKLSSMSPSAQQTAQPSRIVYSSSLEAQHHNNYIQHTRRSPCPPTTSPSAALVMGATPPPPQASTPHMSRTCASEPSIAAILLSQSDCTDSQPLNLSKKASPPNSPTADIVIKIES